MKSIALLIGINRYPDAPLQGCENDVLDIAQELSNRFGFRRSDIRLLVDGRATREAILSELHTLVSGLKSGDRGYFHFSGHGVQLQAQADGFEEDGLDEAIVPVDYTWNDLNSFIRDKDLRRILREVPAGVSFLWTSDSCHSGDLNRPLRAPGTGPHRVLGSRQLPLPADLKWRVDTLRSRRPGKRSLERLAAELQLAFISGCKPEQTSADAMFDERPNGAFSYFFLSELKRDDVKGRTLEALVAGIRNSLDADGFEQKPLLEGPPGLLSQPPFHEPARSEAAPQAWQGVFAEVERRAAKDPEFSQKLISTNSRHARELVAALNLGLGTPQTDLDTARARGGTVVRAFWWGFHVEVSHEDLTSFLSVATPINEIAAAIGPVTGPAAPFVALVAAFIAGALGLLQGLDKGRGVYVSMSWFAPGVFVPTTV